MSSTSTSITPKALLDTTVLCGALLTNGVNRQILYSAQLGFYQPVISNVCLLEFIRNAAEGIGNRKKKKVFDWETIDSFLNQFVFPALQDEEVTNSVVSRNSYEVIKMLTKMSSISIGDALLKISSCTTDQAQVIVHQYDMQLPLELFDIQDFHVWTTAIETRCNYIVTRNTKRFPSRIGSIVRIDPIDFIENLGGN
ncbi:PIN domain-containing protein [Neobacillus niacini]|uniref:PIN domain-containing protein n=1 Tax=Neobacillus niacini TaxID=86668 RepID=UPI001C8E83CB|nr:PIN domain-containing protein [Neobacillus niacini]MBY0145161.1 PIN domain-containing protein [Neobacillus niacini]